MAVYFWTKHKTKLYKLFIFILAAYYIYSIKPLEDNKLDNDFYSIAKDSNQGSIKDVNTSSDKRVIIDRCNCSRVLPTVSVANEEYSSTTCSPHAWARGRGQKVVGFSYYGDSHSDHHKSKGYLQGIEDNMRALNK